MVCADVALSGNHCELRKRPCWKLLARAQAVIERDGRVFIGGLGRDDPIWKRGSDARPIAADMQPEPVRGGHEDAREAPIWVGPFGER